MQFTGLEFLFWASMAVTPFTVVFLRGRGISNSTIGLMLAFNSLIGIFAQPFWGIISDWLKSVKKVFIICFSACAISYCLLPFTRSVIFVAVVLAVDVFFRSSLATLLDTWVIFSISNNSGISYGSVRLWGSVGFAIMAYIFGKLINGMSISIMFPIYFIVVLVTVIFCSRIESGNASFTGMKLKDINVGKLFKNYNYIAFIIFALLLQIPNTPAFSFLPNLVEQLGGSREQYGLIASLKAFVEIPFFILGKYLLDRFGHMRLLVFSSCLYVLQQFLYFKAASTNQVLGAALLSGPAFSLFLMGMLYYIYSMSPEGSKATAQTLASALSLNLGSIIGNYGGGLVIDNFGLKSIFLMGAIIQSSAILLFVLYLLVSKRFAGIKQYETNIVENDV